MVGEGEQPPEKTVEEIAREAEVEIAWATHLAETGKRHNGMHDDSGSSDDEPRDGSPSRRHYPKFDPRCPTYRDRLRDWSQSIRDEIGRIEYQGEQVYRTLAHNALASRMLID
jgi:hypothetical protein